MKSLYIKTLILAQLMAISFTLGYCAKPDAVEAYDVDGLNRVIEANLPIEELAIDGRE